MKADVAVLGGGLAGLAAAIELSRRGRKVVLLEQAPRLGGRCYSYVDATTGDVVDNGQHVLLGAYHQTLRYLEIVGTRKFLTASSGLSLMMHHPVKKFSRFEVKALPRPFHLTAAMLSYRALSLRDRQKLLKVGFALQRRDEWNDERLAKLTIECWLRELGQSEDALRSLWYPIAVSVMNELPERASALLFARSLRAAFLGRKSDSAVLIPSIGQSQLYVAPAEELLRGCGATIRLNAEVTEMRASRGRIARVILKDGTHVEPRAVICAVPHNRFARMFPAGEASGASVRQTAGIGSSPIISIHLWFDTVFMKDAVVGIIGRSIQWIFNRRMILNDRRADSSYLSAVISAAHDTIEWTKADLIVLALKDLAAVYPASANAKLLHAVVIKERRATFSATNRSEPLRLPAETEFGNCWLAGDWTDTGLPATIEGAVKSGFTAAEFAAVR